MNKKIIAGIFAGLAILSLAGTLVAKAAPYEWRWGFRNSDDSDDIMTSIPQKQVNRFGMLGAQYDIVDPMTPRWYYLGEGLEVESCLSQYCIRVTNVPLGNITGAEDALAVKLNSPTGTIAQYIRGNGTLATFPTLGVAYEGLTQRASAFPVFKSATVGSGVAVFYLTTDGTSGGTAMFPNGIIQDSIDVEVNDALASYQMSYALSNSNKTLTVTANKLTTANILTGILGQSAANGSVVKLQAWGY